MDKENRFFKNFALNDFLLILFGFLFSIYYSSHLKIEIMLINKGIQIIFIDFVIFILFAILLTLTIKK